MREKREKAGSLTALGMTSQKSKSNDNSKEQLYRLRKKGLEFLY